MSIKYEIVTAGIIQELQDSVQQRLDAGWSLVGGPFLENCKNPLLCQAMTRRVGAREAALTSGAVSKNSDGSFEFGVPGDATA